MKKTFVVFPLVINPRDFKLDAACFVAQTTIDNVMGNITVFSWEGEKLSYSIITDSIDANKKLIFGRLLKLRKGAISQIGPDAQQKLKEEVVANKPGQYLLEPAYFLLDYENNIILGQYTSNSVNILSHRPIKILKSVFLKCHLPGNNIDISTIPTDKLLKAMLANKPLVNQFKIKLKNIDVNFARRTLGLSDSAITKLMGNNDVEFTLNTKFKHGKTRFDRSTLDILKGTFTKEDKHSESVKIYTDNGSYDIIKDNFISYTFDEEIEINKEIDDANYRKLIAEIYREIEILHVQNLQTILSSIKEGKTLYDYDDDT